MSNKQNQEKEVLWANMRRPELQELSEKGAIVIVPLGSTEQHGPHMPTGTDSQITTAICQEVARKVVKDIPITVLPTFPVGDSKHHMDFCGSLTLQPQTFLNATYEICQSVIQHGFKKFIIVNGHGGNVPISNLLASQIGKNYEVVAIACNYWDVALSSERGKELKGIFEEGTRAVPSHAGEFETSMQMFLNAQLVNSTYKNLPLVKRKRETPEGTFLYIFWKRESKEGYFGDPSLASKEKGRKSFNLIVESLSRLFLEVASWKVKLTCPP